VRMPYAVFYNLIIVKQIIDLSVRFRIILYEISIKMVIVFIRFCKISLINVEF